MSYFSQTGQWTGYYEQNKLKTKMYFKNFLIYPAAQGFVKGEG